MEDFQTGWLSPEGKLIPCETYDHIEMAYNLVDEYNYMNPNNIPSDDILLKNQWVHITISTFFDFGYHIIWEGKLTPECYSYLKEVYENPNINITKFSRMIWEEYNELY